MEDNAGPGRRPGGRSARVRRQIIEVVFELIARDGIGGLSYEQIAERAGVNKTTVYRNWPDRATLIADALVSFGEDVAPLHDSGDLAADITDFLDDLAVATESPRGRAVLNIVTAARDNPELRAVVDEVFDRRVEMVKDRLQASVDRGELPAADLALLAAMLAGPVQLFASRGVRTFTRDDARRVTAIVLAGVRATAKTL
ncbi:MAG: TetR/AcrR family transcriptional regulator [Mycolicibacterium neoaurum]|uniref:TetR/AcrR family transcriptional regulator n=1 Tax=Mycolicibacterium neoaurum TaxID=1795 RepID=UPI002FF8D2A0